MAIFCVRINLMLNFKSEILNGCLALLYQLINCCRDATRRLFFESGPISSVLLRKNIHLFGNALKNAQGGPRQIWIFAKAQSIYATGESLLPLVNASKFIRRGGRWGGEKGKRKKKGSGRKKIGAYLRYLFSDAVAVVAVFVDLRLLANLV